MNSPNKPQEVEIIILHGKDLVGRKSGLQTFSCVFGVGSKKYATSSDSVDNGNPKWNEEAVIPIKVDCKDDLVIKIMENNKKIGKIKLPLSKIPNEAAKSLHNLPIKPARNCPNSSGEVFFNCWVTKTHSNLKSKTLSSNKINRFYSKSVKMSSTRSIDYSGLNSPAEPKLRIFDKSNYSRTSENGSNVVDSSDKSSAKSSDKVIASAPVIPHIMSIKPSIIRADKKEKIAIHGKNFGSSIDEILNVEIGGKSIMSKIMHHSSSLIFATIDPYTLEPNESGKIIITNKMNVRGTCNDVLKTERKQKEYASLKRNVATNTFVNNDSSLEEKIIPDKDENSVIVRVPVAKTNVDALKIRNSELVRENEGLKKHIEELREKLDQLISKVMTENPDILEIL